MPTELAGHGGGGVWLTITELADRLGVRKSTVSEKVAALTADGLIETKPGKGRTKLVHLASYLRATGQAGDAAKEAGAATRAALAAETALPLADAPPTASNNPTFRDAQTREKELAADLKELELKQRLGELVAVADLAGVAEQAAEQMVAALDRLPTRAEDMAAAVGRDGTAGARAQYKRDARDLRASIAEAFKRLLAISPATAAYEVEALRGDRGVLWGDLDPAEHGR